MTIKYNESQYNNSELNSSLINIECSYCGDSFVRTKKYIKAKINKNVNMFCNKTCYGLFYRSRIESKCSNCNKRIIINPCNKSESGNNFCNSSCAATYNNKHKTHGNRRSKLEVFIEQKLSQLYPEVDIQYNKKDAIGSELDIYIPSIKLAIELNGIYHYEPIHGIDKLDKIKINDNNKFQQCIANNISLCIIDTSSHKYITDKSSQKFLDIIVGIINQNL